MSSNGNRHPLIEEYIRILKAYNTHTNIYSKHAYDKLEFHIQDCERLSFHLKKNGHIYDFGSGSGLPSILLSILKPKSTIHAIDSTLKKTSFLFHVKQELGLNNLEVHHMDVLSFLRSNKKKPIYITAKAFASFEKIKSFTDRIKYKGLEVWVPVSRDQKKTLEQTTKEPIHFIESDGHIYLIYIY